MVTQKSGKGRRPEVDFYDVWNTRVRDAVLFLIGSSGCIYEIFFVVEPRPSILIFLGSLIGMPFVLGADEKRMKKKNGEGG